MINFQEGEESKIINIHPRGADPLLAMTEEITLIHHSGLSEETYRKALEFFNENQIAQIIMLIVTINGWNRIALSTHLEMED